MTVYIYRNYITDSEDAMDDLIFEKLSENNKCPNDERVASEYESVEKEEANAHDLFAFMKQGYIFVAHCGKA